MTTFYSDMEPLSKYSPVNMHLSPATRIPSEALGIRTQPVFQITLISKLPQRKSVCGLTFLFSHLPHWSMQIFIINYEEMFASAGKVTSLRKQVTFREAITGFPAK